MNEQLNQQPNQFLCIICCELLRRIFEQLDSSQNSLFPILEEVFRALFFNFDKKKPLSQQTTWFYHYWKLEQKNVEVQNELIVVKRNLKKIKKIKLSVRPPHGPNPLTADSQLVFQILLRLEVLASAEQAQEATHFDKKRSNLGKMFKQSLEVCHSE